MKFRILGLIVCSASCILAAQVEVKSPDGNVTVRLQAAADTAATWSVSYRGRPVIGESTVGLMLEPGGLIGPNMTISRSIRAEKRSQWRPVYGERVLIPERYREAAIDLQGGGRTLRITLRAYDEGGAIRYTIPAQNGLKDVAVLSEQTQFATPPGTFAWETYTAQSTYRRLPVAQVKKNCERPLTLELSGGTWASIFEAANGDYSRMLLSPDPAKPGVLVSTYAAFPVTGDDRAKGTTVHTSTPFSTPWRGVIVGDRPGDLLERNYLLLNLSPPSTYPDTSWIKPGKVMRETTLSTKGGKETIDFARLHNFQYVEYDAGWYGPETSGMSDATRVNIDPARLSKLPGYQGLDLPEVIRYGRENGIRIMLYVNRRALERQRDDVLALFEQWGVAGIKFGFVNVGSQYWTKWLYDSVEAAAKRRLVVDIHDEFRPTGMSRTYPNLLTQEGIAGNETMPDAEHNTILPFTRYLAGAADNTVCYFDPRIKTTRALQLALPVVYYSPLQFLYWYDRPSSYHGEPELEFWDKVKTVWDETKVVDGRPGEFVTIARRADKDWFVGTITSAQRRVRVPLAFLPKGRAFRAHIYENSAAKNDVALRTIDVTSASAIEAALPAAGGQSIWLEAR